MGDHSQLLKKKKLKGDHHQLAGLEMSWLTPSGPGKVAYHITWETLEKTPIPLGNWVYRYQPGDELWFKDGGVGGMGTTKHFSQFGQALTQSSWQTLLLLEL